MPSTSQPELGQRVRELREAKGMSQWKLAVAADTTPNTISALEIGNRTPNVTRMHAIATALGVSLDELVGQAAEEAS